MLMFYEQHLPVLLFLLTSLETKHEGELKINIVVTRLLCSYFLIKSQ